MRRWWFFPRAGMPEFNLDRNRKNLLRLFRVASEILRVIDSFRPSFA
jgi:hypothetical protein